MHTSVITLCLAVLVAPTALAQDNVPAREVADKDAKELVTEFKKQINARKKNLIGRINAVKSLGRNKNNLLVDPLVALARSDSAKSVRQEAVRAIGKQPKKRARPALTKMLAKASVSNDPATAAAIVRAIGNNCYDSRDWVKLKKMFNKALTNKRAADAQRAILEAVGKNKEIEAAKFLVDHIDAPAPAWVDDPANPPAAYWEARHKNWRRWKDQVTTSLYEITGQRFGTSKEARIWMKRNLSKLRRSAKATKSKRGKQKRR